MLEKHGNIIKKVFGEMSDDINLIFKNSNRAPGLLFDINTIHENDEWYDSYLSWKKRQE
jgi:hypothetical protein